MCLSAPNAQPWSDLDERLRLALRAQTSIRNYAGRLPTNHAYCEKFESFKLNMMHLSLFVCWDLDDLRTMEIRDGKELYQILNNVEPFLANALAEESNNGYDAQPHEMTSRSEDARDIAMVRDSYQCIVTKTSDPNMCCIVPCSISNTVQRADQMRSILRLMVEPLNWTLSRGLRKLLCPVDKLGIAICCSTDIPANFIALHPDLSRRWSNGKFFFEWIDSETESYSYEPFVFKNIPQEKQLELTKFRLRFHWLSRTVSEALSAHHLDSVNTNKGRAVKEIRLESEVDIAAIISTVLAIPPEGDAVDGHEMPIESGRLITCHAQTSDLDNTRTLFKLQEVYKKMACFSGAADVAEHLDRDARHEPEIPPFIPKEWYERLARREAERRAEARASR